MLICGTKRERLANSKPMQFRRVLTLAFAHGINPSALVI